MNPELKIYRYDVEDCLGSWVDCVVTTDEEKAREYLENHLSESFFLEELTISFRDCLDISEGVII